ncbi:DNA translocase FtsK 4TM domain-containing protein [Gilliamella sp. B2889]|uniref:DNA translocase FtsK 4TM domain-containing protein n=1 Tax=Gilliamella sp. B2889 TaxID=2817985 RepID=UPI003A5D087D|nr:DNA translocase FtsK 4TM domain-containing protein [Gilliamella sp. B2889]
MKKSKITRRQIVAQLILLSLIGLSVYLFLSLFTYNPSDPGWSRTAWHYPISNLGGYIGAYISDILFQFFGLIAYSLPVIIIFFCLQLMGYFYRHANDPINYFSVSFRIIGILAFVLSCCGFFALNIRDPEQFQAGGYLGSIVIESLLPVMSSLATSLALLATTLACITLLTGFSWLYLFEKIGALVMFILSPIKWLFTPDKVSQPADSNQEDKLTTEKQPQFDLPIDVDTSDNIDSTKLATESDISTTKPISLKDDEVFIKTAAQLLQSIEANTSPNETNQPTKDISKKEMDPDAILARMETILKNMNESTTSDMSSTESDGVINSREALEPFEEDKYAIADAPSKPLFTMEHNEPKINLNHITSQDSVDPIVIEPLAETSPSITPEYHNTNDIPAEFEIPEDVDISLLKEENPLIDDIYQNEVVNESNEQQTNNEIKEVTDEDEEESLIHPLLKRNDKPLPKPTTPLPSLNLLTPPPTTRIEVDHAALNTMSEQIEKSLSDYRVKARVVDYLPGPVITRFEIELAPGIKAARISTLDRDLARSLSMPSVRVVEVIPGKPYVGIELPNKNRQTVYFREVLDSPQFKNAQSPLTIVLGKDIAGQSVVADLAKMPHLLVAGTTGSGKSVGVNAMILSILYKSQPEDVRFIMIDPKMLELSIYEGIPHLLTQVVTDMKDAANALNWCVNEMERRYRLMSALGVRNIAGFNEKIKLAEEMGRPIPDPLWKPTDSLDLEIPTLEKLPYIVVMVDEFADLIMAVGKKVEELIARLAQKARAAGIHLVLATQRPSVDVITGLIKANIPTRIAFTVSSKIDSRTILDQMGAESLLGMGDMLYLAPNSSIPIRVHGAFVRDEEVHAVVQDWKARGTPKYIENVTVSTDDNEGNSFDMTDEELDPLFDQVVAFVVETRRASISSVQRKFRIGYNRAARIVEQMEVEGIISAPSHNGNREVLAQASPNDY